MLFTLPFSKSYSLYYLCKQACNWLQLAWGGLQGWTLQGVFDSVKSRLSAHFAILCFSASIGSCLSDVDMPLLGINKTFSRSRDTLGPSWCWPCGMWGEGGREVWDNLRIKSAFIRSKSWSVLKRRINPTNKWNLQIIQQPGHIFQNMWLWGLLLWSLELNTFKNISK